MCYTYIMTPKYPIFNSRNILFKFVVIIDRNVNIL